MRSETVVRCLACAFAKPTARQVARRRSSVAATVHEAEWCAQCNRCLEATGLRRLNAQSPSERWDGDCAWSQSMLGCFGLILGQTRQRPHRTVATTGDRRDASEAALHGFAGPYQLLDF